MTLTNPYISYRVKLPHLWGKNGEMGEHKDFRLSVATGLMKSGLSTESGVEPPEGASNSSANAQHMALQPSRKRRRSTNVLLTDEARLDCSISHLPAFIEHRPRRTCVVCALKSSVKCSGCGVFLCVRAKQCFAVYHQMPVDMLATMRASGRACARG